MQERRSRGLIRILTGVALSVALAAAVLMPVPDVLPAIALKQVSLYRLEVTLLVFYGWLLVITPAFSGLLRGQLPVEISTRGARFAEEAHQSAKSDEKRIERLRDLINGLADRQDKADIKIQQLKEASPSDNTQPAIGSKK